MQIDNAMDLIEASKPKWTDELRQTYLERMMDDGLSRGLTCVHDARASLEDYRFYRRWDFFVSLCPRPNH